MQRPNDATLSRLLDAARKARSNAYAPYSQYRVGAALLDEQGRIHAGCNVENAAYPQGQCAEANAIGALVVAGGARVVAAVVAGASGQWVTPCGGCRQKLREFASADVPVYSANETELGSVFTLAQLLPESFGPDHLNQP
jgi:cytidine deaminase